jgi:hypothetical protein
MRLQEKMFSEIEAWMASGVSKSRFLEDKNYSEAKFNYWLSKWKSRETLNSEGGFQELNFTDLKSGKVLEIQMTSGVKITFFG